MLGGLGGGGVGRWYFEEWEDLIRRGLRIDGNPI